MIITKKKIFDKYPEILSIDELNSLNLEFSQQVKDENFKSTNHALKYAIKIIKDNKKEFVLYTLCDSENSDDLIYFKGNHICNRIGIWEIIKSKYFEAQNV